MATYATQADFEAYVEGWVTEDAAALERLLKRAEKDIDREINTVVPEGTVPDPTTDLIILPIELDAWRKKSLSRAVCAQAEYRLAKGEDFFVEKQMRVGEFATTSAKEPRLAPKAKEELLQGQFLALTGRMR